MDAADWIVTAEYLAALAALVGFVAGYVWSSRGRALRTPEGRHLVTFRASLAALMLMAIVHNLTRDYPGQDLVRCAVVGWFMLAALQGVQLMVRAQRRARAGRNVST